jgi:hypothetical protein
MKTLTKTQQLRQVKSGRGYIIYSAKGNAFLLIPYSHMVQIDNFDSPHYTEYPNLKSFTTYSNHSLDIGTVKRIVRKPSGASGRVRNGWRYTVGSTALFIGCQKFIGANRDSLIKWATQK